MRPSRLVPLALALPLAMGACGSDTMRTLGLTRDAPDEFAVMTRAPLAMPPDMTSLPAPRPGATRPQEVSARDAAEAALVPGAALAPTSANRAGASGAESALLSQAGRDVPDSIRRQVDEESSRLDAPNRSFTDRLMFWRDAPPPGTAVDPSRENARLRENAALGRDATAGETPIIQRQRRSFLGIF